MISVTTNFIGTRHFAAAGVTSIETLLLGGNDNLTLRRNVSQPVLATFGTGTNSCSDNGTGNFIAVGGNGADRIQGGRGFNLLIGGDGGDTLLAGGSKGTLMVGGRTDFDSDPTATSLPNVAALDAIMAEWSSGDSYNDRVNKINGTEVGGANGSYFLNGATVHADKCQNALEANSGPEGTNYFIADGKCPKDSIVGKKKNEQMMWIYPA